MNLQIWKTSFTTISVIASRKSVWKHFRRSNTTHSWWVLRKEACSTPWKTWRLRQSWQNSKKRCIRSFKSYSSVNPRCLKTRSFCRSAWDHRVAQRREIKRVTHVPVKLEGLSLSVSLSTRMIPKTNIKTRMTTLACKSNESVMFGAMSTLPVPKINSIKRNRKPSKLW